MGRVEFLWCVWLAPTSVVDRTHFKGHFCECSERHWRQVRTRNRFVGVQHSEAVRKDVHKSNSVACAPFEWDPTVLWPTLFQESNVDRVTASYPRNPFSNSFTHSSHKCTYRLVQSSISCRLFQHCFDETRVSTLGFTSMLFLHSSVGWKRLLGALPRYCTALLEGATSAAALLERYCFF